jgi:aminoglycoside phosphotransferase
VRPGGWIVWECAAGFRRAEAVERALGRAGCEVVERYWARPTPRRALQWISLSDRDGIAGLLARLPQRRSKRLAAHAARALHRRDWLTGWLPAVVIARRAGGNAPVHDAAAAVLAASPEAAAWLGPGSVRRDWRTPRFRASSHVVCLLTGDTAGAGIALKFARQRGANAALRREAGNLRGLAREGLPAGLPRLLGLAELGGHEVLITTRVPGRTLDPGCARENPRAVAAAMAWCTTLHRVTARRAPESEVRARVLRDLEPWLGRDAPPGSLRDLAARTQAFLATHPLPGRWVLEHGDFASPNLLWDPAHGVAVVDWESADADGLPAGDLFFFAAYAAGARMRARTPDEHAQAMSGAWRATDFRLAYDAYRAALELPPETLPALFVATWARSTARAVGRTGNGRIPGEPGVDAARAAALWRFALDHGAALAGGPP